MEYSAFGVLRSVKDSTGNEVGFENAPVRTSFTYTGREFEPELNMYYYRARYCDPNTGRFLQQDPDPGKLESPSTFLSKYIYVGNNPVMFTDPSGRSILGDIFEGIGNMVNGIFNAGSQAIANLGAAFDNLVKNKTFQIICVIIAAAFIGPAAAGFFGATGWAGVAVSAVVGGLVGGLSYVGLGLGTFAEGFALGALAGGLSYYAQYGVADGIAGSTGNLVASLSDCLKQRAAAVLTAEIGVAGLGLRMIPHPAARIAGAAAAFAGAAVAARAISYGIGCGNSIDAAEMYSDIASLKLPLSTPINDKMNIKNENNTYTTNQYVTFNWSLIEKWIDFVN